jgi:hypothetical protein
LYTLGLDILIAYESKERGLVRTTVILRTDHAVDGVGMIPEP